MKHLITSTLLLSTLMFGTAMASSGDTNGEPETKIEKTKVDETTGIEFFHGTWAEAQAKAKKEGKRIFFDAYAVWCGPCKVMARKTFTQKEVADYFNKNFINVKMDMEKGEGPGLARKYKIRAYPTLFIMDDAGKVVGETLGYQTPEQLVSFGKKYVK